MKKYIFAVIIFGIMLLISVTNFPSIGEISNENFLVIILLFIIAHFLELNVASKITVVGDIGVYLMAIFTLPIRSAFFVILIFSLITFLKDLRVYYSSKKDRYFIGNLVSVSVLYIVFIVGYLFNQKMNIPNIVFKYAVIFFLCEILVAIPYLIRSISGKIHSSELKKDIKYYILNDVFFATFFFPFIYFFKSENYELYNIYLINVILFYFIIYYLVKNMWVHRDYLFALIRLHEFANYLTNKEGEIDVLDEVKKSIKRFFEKKLIDVSSIKDFVADNKNENIWNLKTEGKYLSKVFLKEGIKGQIDIYSKDKIYEREQDVIDLLIKQISTIAIYTNVSKTIQHDFFAVLEALIELIEAKDPYSAGHSKRVSYYAEKIAGVISPENRYRVRLSALLHDIGKLKVPTEILTKKGRLTDHEFDLIKRHPVYGFEMLINLKGLDDIIDGVLYHHERLDGSGYPYGVTGKSIPLIARIIHVADMYDAMTSDRPYRKKMTDDECFSILLEESKKGRIEARIVNVLIDVVKKRKDGKTKD